MTEFADGEYLYLKQIKAIRQVWPNASIIYITGFNCDKIDFLLKKEHVKVIHNLDYDKTTICHSLNKAFKEVNNSTYLLYGNIYFSHEVLTNCLKNVIIDTRESQGIVLTSFLLDKKSLGIGTNGFFDYSFPEKWAKIAYFSGEYFNFIKKEISNHTNYCLEEILNQFIDNDLFLSKIDIRQNKLIDIKQYKDIKYINEHYLGKKYAK